MKRRCFPLRGDHSLLTPDPPAPPTLSGVGLRDQVWSEGVTSSLIISGSTKRRPAASPTRRLRFEDETEMEAESRYLERQWRRGGQRGAVLLSKPDPNLYINGRGGLQHRGAEPVFDRQQRGQTFVMVGGHGGGSVPGGRDLHVHRPPPEERRRSLDLHVHRPPPEERRRSLSSRHRLHLHTEPLRETYIGHVTSTDPTRAGGGNHDPTRAGGGNHDPTRAGNHDPTRAGNHDPTRAGGGNHDTTMQVKRKAKQNGAQVNAAPPTIELPINPYASNKLRPPDPSTVNHPPSSSPPASVVTSEGRGRSQTATGRNQNHGEPGRPAPPQSHGELHSGSELGGSCVEGGAIDATLRKPSWRSSEMGGEDKAPPTSHSSDGQVRQPISEELPSDETFHPEHFSSRDAPARLSLRHLFSSVRLSRTRSASLDRLSSKPRPLAPDHTPPGTRKSCSPLKKSPSSQSLCVGSPVLQLRKSLSVQSFGSEPKKKNRSADYRPAADQFLHRSLSVEDIGHPRSVRSVGRVLQVCSDGTVLVELSRPTDRKYGFIISRGRGRPDSGVYVEDMADSGTEKLYGGLLAVGDEIVEVNGEKVSGLDLDQVTQLLLQNPSNAVRVLRHHRASPR